MELSERNILTLTLSIEGMLLLLGLIWGALRGFDLSFSLSLPSALLAILATAALFMCYRLLSSKWARQRRFMKTTTDFIEDMVRPLAGALSLEGAVVVSVAAGVCEEVFFRGVLQQELGLWIASGLFALAHVGPAASRYRLLTFLYLLVGLFLGWLAAWTGSLAAPVLTHVCYDLAVLVDLRRRAPLRPSSTDTAPFVDKGSR